MSLQAQYREQLLLSMCQSQFGLFKNGGFLETAGPLHQLTSYQLQTADMNAFGNYLRTMGVGAADVNPKQAVLRALYEGLERQALIFHNPRKVIRECTQHEISREFYTPEPETWSLCADWQYEQPGFSLQPYHQDLELNWVEVEHAWIRDRKTVVPFPLVHHEPPETKNSIAVLSTNGAAFHSNLEQSKQSALLELIERDSLLLHWRCYQPAIRIDLESALTDRLRPALNGVLARRQSLSLLLLQNEFDVPVVAAAYFGDDPQEPPFSLAAAAALDLQEAIKKCLFELGQHLASHRNLRSQPQGFERMSLETADRDVKRFSDHMLYFHNRHHHRELDVLLNTGAAERSYGELEASFACGPKSFAALVQVFKDREYDLMFKSFPTPELERLGCHVVRALCPALIPLDYLHVLRALGSRRFQTVPARLRWPGRVLQNRELNPHPHPFN